MADPFLGMFEGGNGLDDLGLGSSLGPFGNQGTQAQERLQHGGQSFPGFQSQTQPMTNQQHKLQHFVEERATGSSQFLPPSQKLQHFNDPLLSSSSQPFQSLQSSPQQHFSQLQNRSAQQFPSSPQGNQMNMQAWKSSSSNFPAQLAQQGPRSGLEQASFRQPFNYAFQRSPSPRLKHFMNSPQSDRFVQSSQSPGLQTQSRSPSMPYSSSPSPKRSSPKHLEQQQQQMSPQQSLRHYISSDMNHQADLATQKRLQHMSAVSMASSGSLTGTNSSKSSFPNSGDQTGFASFFGGPQESGTLQNDSPNKMGPDQGALFNSNQFPTQGMDHFPPNLLGMASNSQGMFPRDSQQQGTPSSQVQRYPFTDFSMSNSPGFLHMKTSSVLLQMQRIQQQIQQHRELGQSSQLPQLQHQFQQLYQVYVVQEQQRMQQGYPTQHPEQLHMMRQQQQQDKANRIVVEAMAKAALQNSSTFFPLVGMPSAPSGPRMMGIAGMSHMGESARVPRPSEPLQLGPSIVHKPMLSRNVSSR